MQYSTYINQSHSNAQTQQRPVGYTLPTTVYGSGGGNLDSLKPNAANMRKRRLLPTVHGQSPVGPVDPLAYDPPASSGLMMEGNPMDTQQFRYGGVPSDTVPGATGVGGYVRPARGIGRFGLPRSGGQWWQRRQPAPQLGLYS